MFKQLEKPNIDWDSILRDFFDSRTTYKEFYKLLRRDYIASHVNYDLHQADFKNISPLIIRNYCSDDQEAIARVDTLKNLYLSKTSYFSEILDKMRTKNGLLSCPNCGEDGSPNTLDHYLPKTIYPELSVCIYNLIPMCSKCQSEKSDDYKDKYDNKMFFHPYYDYFPNDMYILEILPMPYYNTPKFSIKVRNNVPLDIKEVAFSQFKNLNLYERFNSFISQTYITVISSLIDSNNDLNELLEMFIKLHIKKGLNNWNIILYKSILENESLLSWIEQQRRNK